MASVAMVIFLWCVWLVTFSARASAFGSRSCYRYDGSLNDYSYNGFDKYFPCSPDQEVSHCCFGLDLCLDNGLCMGFGPAPGKDRVLTLAGCTDGRWPSPCPQYFVADRHNVPDGLLKVTLWPCNFEGEYCVGSKDRGGVAPWDASCCADENLRIKGIPWQKSMHMAMDPTQKLEIFAGDLSNAPGGGGTSKDSGYDVQTALTIGSVIVAVVGSFIAFCQWQYPKTRLHWSWIRRHMFDTGRIRIGHRGGVADPAEPQGTFRDADDVVDADVEALAEAPGAARDRNDVVYPDAQDGTPYLSYSDRIGDLLETEDGWREQ